MTTSVLTRIAALKTAPIGALKQQWRDLFESEPPPYNRRFLGHRLAYRIQELAYGGLKPRDKARNIAERRPMNSKMPLFRSWVAHLERDRQQR